MITVITVKLRALDPVILPEFSGTTAVSVLLRLLATVDPHAAVQAHQDGTPRSYSVTPLLTGSGRPAPQLVNPGAQLQLRVAIADDRLAQTLAEALLTGEALQITLGRARLYTEAIDSKITFHHDLPATPFTGAKVRFHTPVRFSVASTRKRRNPKFRLFPIPEHVFHSLADHWNLYAPTTLKTPEWLPQLVRDYIVETGYRLRRVKLRGTEGRVFVGSTGWVNYRPVEPVDDGGWLTRLLAYGQLFNVGTGHSIGLGMMTWEKLEPKQRGPGATEPLADGED